MLMAESASEAHLTAYMLPARTRRPRPGNPIPSVRLAVLVATGGALAGAAAGLYTLLVRGNLTVDLGVGRTLRPLGPLVLQIDAPREIVFSVISAPYLSRTPKALEQKLHVLERSKEMALAAHFTPIGPLVATTVETIRFEAPHRVHFRLVRGPVPHVVERFELRDRDGGTELEYVGELGADLWGLGRRWAGRVARRWENTVRGSLASVKAEAERLASRQTSAEDGADRD